MTATTVDTISADPAALEAAPGVVVVGASPDDQSDQDDHAQDELAERRHLAARRISAVVTAVHALIEGGITDGPVAEGATERASRRIRTILDDSDLELGDAADLDAVVGDLDGSGLGELLVAAHETLAVIGVALEGGLAGRMQAARQQVPPQLAALVHGNAQTPTVAADDGTSDEAGGYL